MRYLAICCFVMLGIALAHAIPSHRFQGLRAVPTTPARIQSKHLFGVRSTLIDKLRALKKKTSRQLHTERQTENTEPTCKDDCLFSFIDLTGPDWWIVHQIDGAFDCAGVKVWNIEQQFDKEFYGATGEHIFSEEEYNDMWDVRISDELTAEEKLIEEEEYEKEALKRMEDKRVEPNEDLLFKFGCIKSQAYDFLEYLEFLEKNEYITYHEYQEYQTSKKK